MNLTSDQIRWIFIDLFLLVVSVALHEFGHAAVADWLGDDTPRRQGRVTLNPLAHADPIGTIAMPIIGGIFGAASGMGGGFGWGKPVQWQPHRITRKISMATGRVMVSLAGPGMNLVLGTVVAIVHVVLMAKHVITMGGDVSKVMMAGVSLNFVLMFFNLLPVPPLDGRSLVEWVLPTRYRASYESIERFGPFIVLAFVMIRPLAKLFLIPAMFCVEHLYHLLFSIAGM